MIGLSQKKKYRKKGKTHGQKIKLVRGRTAKRKCGVCGKQLHGMPHGLAKCGIGQLSKTEKRPSAPFAGALCSDCRTIVAEETAKISSGKKIEEVELRYRPFVEKTIKRN